MKPTLKFLGGAGTVTGSKYLLSYNGENIFIDCGLFQGVKSLRLKNWDGVSIEPSKISAVILTHAHIDHSGFIPRLIKKGFKGKIFATPATLDLCKILLPDCGHLMEEEAEFLNRRKRSKHDPALPLFTEEEAVHSLENFVPIEFNKKTKISDNFSFEFYYAGHILGAAAAVVECGDLKIGFSGDVGRIEDPILYPPAKLPDIDYLLVESTYGNRLHKKTDLAQELEDIINENFKNKGVIIVPAFAVGRVQALLYLLWELKKNQRIPSFPMYLNSPMATNVNELLTKYHRLHRLDSNQSRELCEVVEYVKSVEESKKLNELGGPLLIISASGMLTGGRVLHHIQSFAPFQRNTILLTGFQAAGTRGDSLMKGAEEIKIFGNYVPVRAQVKVMENMSAHADYSEIIDWLERANIHPKKVFIVHGEAAAADEQRRRINEKLGWTCEIPDIDQVVVLE